MRNFDIPLQGLVLTVAALAMLVLLAFHFAAIRATVRQVFGWAQHVFDEMGRGFRQSGETVRQTLPTIERQITRDGKFSFVRMIVAVLVVLPILCLLVVVEVRLWGAYFESLFPELIDLGILGQVPGGVLTAMAPISAALLIGWMVEAMFGGFPLPLLAATTTARATAWLRTAVVIVLVLMWSGLVVTVFYASNEVYDGLGESTCALRSASDPSTNLDSPPAAPTAAVAATQATCVADWKADDGARTIRVVLGLLTLHLSALVGWVILEALALLMLLMMGALAVALGLAGWVTGLASHLVRALLALVELVLQFGRTIGAALVQPFGPLGFPSAPALPVERVPEVRSTPVSAASFIESTATAPGVPAASITSNGTHHV
jgi:hypothetical protein